MRICTKKEAKDTKTLIVSQAEPKKLKSLHYRGIVVGAINYSATSQPPATSSPLVVVMRLPDVEPDWVLKVAGYLIARP